MRTVITGVGGHIGANLIRALIERGQNPVAVVYQDRRALDGLDVETVPADVLDSVSLETAFRGAGTVYHLAARISIAGDPDGSVHAVNVAGTRNVVNACLNCGVERLVHFSSIHALSQQPLEEPVDETRPREGGVKAYAYDRSKAYSEYEALAGLDRGLDVVVAIPTAVIGPHDYKPSAMGRVFLDLYRRRLFGLVDGGFDWVDVRDVAEGAISAAEQGIRGSQYLFSGHWRSLRRLAGLAEEVTGVRAPRLVTPMWLARLAAPPALWWSRLRGVDPRFTPESLTALRSNRNISSKKAASELGYTARPVEETVRDVYGWFEKAGMLDER